MKQLLRIIGITAALSMTTHVWATDSAENVRQHITSADRAEHNIDQSRKPIELIKFMGIQTGMTVLDIDAGGGYATEIFSIAVGNSGKVYAQYNEFATKLMDGNYIAPLFKRTDNNQLPNVELMLAETNAIPLKNEVDVAFWGNNLHDYYNRSPAYAANILASIKSTLKSGGKLVLTDHIGTADGDNAKTHRLNPNVVMPLLKEAGFINISQSDLYHNQQDDHTKLVFDPTIRGNTDRLLIVAVKP